MHLPVFHQPFAQESMGVVTSPLQGVMRPGHMKASASLMARVWFEETQTSLHFFGWVSYRLNFPPKEHISSA